MTDLEAMYRVLGQPDEDDEDCSLFAPPGTTPTSQSKIIGIYKPWFARAEPAVLDLCQKAVDYYQHRLGYQVVEIEIPYLAEGQKSHALTILSELQEETVRCHSRYVSKHKDTSKTWLSGLSPANKIMLSVGAQTTGPDYLLAQQLRGILMRHLAFLYKRYPGMLIVTPTSPMPGWSIKSEGDLKYGFSDANKTLRAMEYVWLANFCGNPAISVPVGYVDAIKTAGGPKIPVGLMAMGDWGSEDQLLQWGRQAELYLNGFYEGGRRRPEGRGWVDVFGLSRGQPL